MPEALSPEASVAVAVAALFHVTWEPGVPE